MNPTQGNKSRLIIAGLSSFQIRIENKIDYLKHELERLK